MVVVMNKKKPVVRRSTIAGAGKGLFTKVFIPKGTRIAEYKREDHHLERI
jgi:hypothetical protein